MKMRFITNNMFFSLALCGSVAAFPGHQVAKPTNASQNTAQGTTQAASVPEGYTQIQCTIVPKNMKEEHISHPHIPGPRLRSTPKNVASSTNWSGFVAANNLTSPTNGTVTAVYGSWIVPTIKSSSVSGNDSSLWIGIDGYSSSTVEQIGTDHSYSGGKQQNYAWFEMYPGGSYLISGFPLNPGDVISASVVYSGNNVFTMTLTNDTQKVTSTIPTSYTTSSTAKRSCAEWIMEAPYLNGIEPLANFGTAYMWGCIATINGVMAQMNNTSWQNSGIEMVTNAGAIKALPSAVLQDNGSFFVVWDHS